MRAIPPAALLALLAMVQLWAPSARSQHPIETIPLQCRLAAGPWQRCTMRIERVGEHWWLELPGERLEFRHNGSGQITVQRESGSVQQVQGRWDQASAALCWDGICALGSIPLD